MASEITMILGVLCQDPGQRTIYIFHYFTIMNNKNPGDPKITPGFIVKRLGFKFWIHLLLTG